MKDVPGAIVVPPVPPWCGMHACAEHDVPWMHVQGLFWDEILQVHGAVAAMDEC